MRDTVQNDAALMQDGYAVSAVSTPTLFRCQMVCRLVKLNGLFVKKSVCKGAAIVVSQPRNWLWCLSWCHQETLLQQKALRFSLLCYTFFPHRNLCKFGGSCSLPSPSAVSCWPSGFTSFRSNSYTQAKFLPCFPATGDIHLNIRPRETSDLKSPLLPRVHSCLI